MSLVPREYRLMKNIGLFQGKYIDIDSEVGTIYFTSLNK